MSLYKYLDKRYQFAEDASHFLGQGGLGSVFRADVVKEVKGQYVVQQGQEVALKKIRIKNSSLSNTINVESLNKEVQYMKDLKHPHVARFIESLRTENNLYIVMEYCKDGNLEQFIYRNRPNEEVVLHLFGQIVSAFKYIVLKMNIMHRDIKPYNILISGGVPKICDFGISRGILSTKEECTTNFGTPLFQSPQILKGDPYTAKADVWSLGVTLYFMLFFRLTNESTLEYDEKNVSTQSYPWYDTNAKGMAQKISLKRVVSFPEDIKVSEEVKDLIRSMLQYEESERISVEALVSHKFFVQYEQNLQEQLMKDDNLNEQSIYSFTQSQLPDGQLLTNVREDIDKQDKMIDYIFQILIEFQQLKEQFTHLYGSKQLLPVLLQGVLCQRVHSKLVQMQEFLQNSSNKRAVDIYKQQNKEQYDIIGLKINVLLSQFEKNLKGIQAKLRQMDQTKVLKSKTYPNCESYCELIQNPQCQEQIINDNVQQLFLGMQSVASSIFQHHTLTPNQTNYLQFLDDIITFQVLDSPGHIPRSHQYGSKDIQNMLSDSDSKQIASPEAYFSRIVSGYKNMFYKSTNSSNLTNSLFNNSQLKNSLQESYQQ